VGLRHHGTWGQAPFATSRPLRTACNAKGPAPSSSIPGWQTERKQMVRQGRLLLGAVSQNERFVGTILPGQCPLLAHVGRPRRPHEALFARARRCLLSSIPVHDRGRKRQFPKCRRWLTPPHLAKCSYRRRENRPPRVGKCASCSRRGRPPSLAPAASAGNSPLPVRVFSFGQIEG
jgi:hypothetical protein